MISWLGSRFVPCLVGEAVAADAGLREEGDLVIPGVHRLAPVRRLVPLGGEGLVQVLPHLHSQAVRRTNGYTCCVMFDRMIHSWARWHHCNGRRDACLESLDAAAVRAVVPELALLGVRLGGPGQLLVPLQLPHVRCGRLGGEAARHPGPQSATHHHS